MTQIVRNRSLAVARSRAIQFASLSQLGGPQEVRQPFGERADEVWGAAELEFRQVIGNISDSDTVRWRVHSRAPEGGRALTTGPMFPQMPGSGIHTTSIRMVQAPGKASHRCGVMYLHDRHQSPGDFNAPRDSRALAHDDGPCSRQLKGIIGRKQNGSS
jgi:hypothetical protein